MHECKTVTLRTRPLKGRMMSFYLDYYPGYRDKETMKVIRHESLGIYIYANPRNKREQNFNEVMTEKAEAIRCRRFESVVNERYDFFDKYKLKADFLEYYRKQLRKHDQKWEFVYLHFSNFVHGKCTFEEIDIDLCNKFREYLLSAKKLRRNGRITRNSASGYWSTFRGFLKILYRNGMIKTNVNDDFDRIETLPQILFEYPNEKISAIDGDITKVGDRYRMFYVSHDGGAGIKQAVSDRINGDYEYDPRWYDFESRACEAPNLWKRIGEDKWVLMYDVYGINPHNFAFIETSDFVNFKNLGRFNEGVMKTTNFSSPKHGAVIHLTKEEAARLRSHWENRK